MWMGLEITILSEVSQEGKTNIIYITYCHCCPISQSCPTLPDPMDCSMPTSVSLIYGI